MRQVHYQDNQPHGQSVPAVGRWVLVLLLLGAVMGLSACQQGGGMAARQQLPAQHVVRSGDTLSLIANRYGLDYRTLASLNRIDPPYIIYVGQRLRLTSGSTPSRTDRSTTASGNRFPSQNQSASWQSASQIPSRAQQGRQADSWQWPVSLPVSQGYNTVAGSKGLRFSPAGMTGTITVQAARAGDVIYASDGLKEYGQLVLVRHPDNYVSAYAQLDQLAVREGQSVERGAVIGTIPGRPGAVPFEFQIRWNGKPVNPVTLLPAR